MRAMSTKRVLVVEDNVKNFELVRDLLELRGLIVLRAVTAEDGIASARDERPDLILMDLSLPGMDGLSAVKILKKDFSTKDIPIIALTAHAMKGDEEQTLDAGCVAYIPKPIDTRAFLKTIENFVQD